MNKSINTLFLVFLLILSNVLVLKINKHRRINKKDFPSSCGDQGVFTEVEIENKSYGFLTTSNGLEVFEKLKSIKKNSHNYYFHNENDKKEIDYDSNFRNSDLSQNAQENSNPMNKHNKYHIDGAKDENDTSQAINEDTGIINSIVKELLNKKNPIDKKLAKDPKAESEKRENGNTSKKDYDLDYNNHTDLSTRRDNHKTYSEEETPSSVEIRGVATFLNKK